MAITATRHSSFIFILSLFLFLFSILGKFGSHYWLFDLFSHFTIQYLWVSIILLITLFIINRKCYPVFALLFASLILNVMNIVPHYRQMSTIPLPDRTIRISSININSLNNDWHSLKNYLANYKPDIVMFFEFTPEWGEKINSLNKIFPYGKAVLQKDNFGIGIISRRPLNKVEIRRETQLNLPFIAATYEISNIPIIIVAAHSYPPISAYATQIRDAYLSRVADYIKDQSSPTILCGDLNITPWSSHFKNVLRISKLTSATGQGPVATWPTFFPFLRIPIDHCLTSAPIQIISYSIGPDIGSDHYPLEAVIALDPKRIPATK